MVNFDDHSARIEMYQLSSEGQIAIPLTAQPVEPLEQSAERIASFVAGAGVDFARGVDEQSIGMAIIGVDEVRIGVHRTSLRKYVFRGNFPSLYDTIIPHYTPFVNPYFSLFRRATSKRAYAKKEGELIPFLIVII